ncbi:hypothetical protein KY366_04185 [Candidatus Woesearchaeota archaeon]|nr:hypothetical protein [Candidatus Woesearchaeota archaeon]
MLDFSHKEPIIFPYKDWEVKTGNSKEKVTRPIALVSLGSKKQIQMAALIDTGSDKTVSYLHPFGQMLGVNVNDFEGEPDQIGGLFTKGYGWSKHIELWIGRYRLNVPVFWLTQKYDPNECNYSMILGRKIIFDNFDVVFCQKEKKVYFYKK